MKKMETWKKVLLIIITLIIAMRIGYIAFRGEVDKEYFVSTTYDLTDAAMVSCSNASQVFKTNQERLNSLEFIFANISEDKLGAIIVAIYSEDELIYQTNITLENVNNWEWKKVFVNAEMSLNKEYKIIFTPNEVCTQIPDLLVVNNSSHATEIMHSYSGEQDIEGQIVINYGYLRQPGILDRLVMISLWIWLWGVLFVGIKYAETVFNGIKRIVNYFRSQVKTQILITILEVLTCLVIIDCSGIEFQASTKIILYCISLIATVKYEEKCDYINRLVKFQWEKILLTIVYIYSAFSLVGQRIWIYPLTMKLTVAGLFVFLCAIFWFIPVINCMLYYLEILCVRGFSNCKKIKTWKFVISSVIILLLPAAYNLFANNPGISTPDTVACMIDQAQHLRGSGDWHPAFYCMVLRAIETVWNSTYAVIIVQYFFWAYVCIELILYLRKKEVKESNLILLTLFLGFNAGNYIHLNTIWKDIPYSLSLFWSIVILAKLFIDSEEYKHKRYIYIELIIALVGMALYRKNGIVPFIIIIAFLIIIFRKNAKVWASVAISVMLFFIIKGPIYSYFEIQPIAGGMYIGLSQDILGVYYAGGEVSEDTLKMINVMTAKNNGEYNYTPTWSYQSYELNVEASLFIRNYIDTFIKNPIIMSRAIIAREDALWNIFAGQDSVLGCVNFYGAMDANEVWNNNYESRKFVSLYNVAAAASDYTAHSQWISAIEWRGGLFTLLGLISFIYMIFKRKNGTAIILLAPAIGQILSLLLTTGWSDFRYFWPLNLLNMALLFFVIIICRNDEVVEK